MSLSKSKHLLFICFLLIFSLGSINVFAQSKYEKITKGVGNILVGEVLPYNNDGGYKNVVIDSVKLSELKKWESFYYRAFFGKKIEDIEHDVRVIAVNFTGVGKKAAQFEKDVGGNTISWVRREDDSADYGQRTEWSRYFANFQTEPATFTYFIKPYDYSKPETFQFATGSDDIAGTMELSAANLEEWKKKYGLTSIVVTMNAFSFVNEGSETVGVNKKVLEATSDGKGGYVLEENEKTTKYKTTTIWGEKKHLATGNFTIVLD